MVANLILTKSVGEGGGRVGAVKEGKAFNRASKIAVLSWLASKQMQHNHKEVPSELWITPKLIQGMTTDHCSYFSLI